MIGAGVCGLTSALGLARHGFRVTVLDKRGDGSGVTGVRELALADQLLDQANASSVDPANIGELLQRSRDIQNRYWGLKDRNVLIDTHTLEYLASLGVDVDGFPHLGCMAIESMEGAFSISADMVPRGIEPTNEMLHAGRVLVQRDFSSQPSLGALERRIRKRLDGQQDIEILFDHRVVGVDCRPDGVRVETADRGQLSADFVIVADGAAASSLSRGSLAEKTVHHTEPISVAVFKAVSGQRLCNRDTASSFTHTSFGARDWIGVFCNGEIVTIAVNDPCPADSNASAAIQRVQEMGFQAPLSEAPFKVSAEISTADRFAAGDRVLLAGDAAMTGNPRFGLGVQYSILWAQHIERLFIDANTTGWMPELGAHERFGRDIACQRRDYELSWLNLISAFATSGWSLSDPNVTAALISASRDFSLGIDAKGDKLLLKSAIRFDFRALNLPETDAISVLRSFGRLSLAADLEITLPAPDRDSDDTAFTNHAMLTAAHPVEIWLDDDRWTLDSGQLMLRHANESWLLELSGARARRHSRDGNTPRRLSLESFRIQFPDSLLDQLMGFSPTALNRIQTESAGQVAISVDLMENAELVWGPLRVRATNTPRLMMTVNRNRKGHPRFSVELLSGQFIPTDFIGYARDSGISSLRWLGQFSALTSGLMDPFINQWAKLAGMAVSGMSFDIAPDGSAIATVNALSPLSVYLSRSDVDRLRESLFNSRTVAELVRRSPAVLHKVRSH